MILDAWRAHARKLVRSLEAGEADLPLEAEELLDEAVVKVLSSRSERYRTTQLELGEARAVFGGFVRGHYANVHRRKARRDQRWHELVEAVERALAAARGSSGRHPRTDR